VFVLRVNCCADNAGTYSLFIYDDHLWARLQRARKNPRYLWGSFWQRNCGVTAQPALHGVFFIDWRFVVCVICEMVRNFMVLLRGFFLTMVIGLTKGRAVTGRDVHID
jgi:hypothetical protein